MENTKAEGEDPAAHQASCRPTARMSNFMLDSLLHPVRAVNAGERAVRYLVKKAQQSRIYTLNPQFGINLPKRGRKVVILFNRIFWQLKSARLLSLLEIKLWILSLHWGSVQYLLNAGKQSLAAWACSISCTTGSWKTDAGCAVGKQSGVRWHKHSLMRKLVRAKVTTGLAGGGSDWWGLTMRNCAGTRWTLKSAPQIWIQGWLLCPKKVIVVIYCTYLWEFDWKTKHGNQQICSWIPLQIGVRIKTNKSDWTEGMK